MNRPTRGEREDRSAAEVSADGRRIHGVIPYNIESRDLGGWTERIAPTAFEQTDFDELRAVVDHAGVPLASYPRTLTVEHRSDGLHWSFEPPKSRQDIVEAVQRGDLRGSSWRMRVAQDSWAGDTRTVERVGKLVDVSLTGSELPAYPATAGTIEYRSTNPASGQEDNMGADEATTTTTEQESPAEPQQEPEATETRSESTEPQSEPENRSRGRLTVTEHGDRRGAPGLAEEFRSHGFPGERATVPWESFERRAVTWSASVDLMNQVDRQGGPLGYDQRYAWPAFPRVPVDAAATSVLVAQQTARSLATPANVVRAIDATTTKPETGSTLNMVTVPLKQVATKQSGVPNVYLLNPSINTVIDNDLALAINDALDNLATTAFAASGFQAPGTDNPYVSIRKAMSTLLNAGYNPDTLLLTPAMAETLDIMVSGISGGTADFVNGVGSPAPGSPFGLSRRVSKGIAAPVVFDSSAFGRLYASPVSLARFEENAGGTNTSLVRMELNAVIGVERQAAAVRIAAS